MSKRSKKILCLVISVLMVVVLFAACKPAEPAKTEPTEPAKQEPAKETEAPAKEEPVEAGASSITLMASQNWIKDVDRELFKMFEDETGIEVKVLVTPDNGYETLLGTTLAGGSNAVDVFMFSAGSLMRNLGIPEIALDLSNEPWVGNLEDWAVDANTVDGKLFGFSTWGIDYEGILYNKTYFEENGLEVPTTWDEFIALCDKIVELGKTPLYEGINGVWHTQSWAYGLTPVIYEENPNFIEEMNASPDNKFSDSAKFMEGLGQIKGLLEAKNGDKPMYYTNDGQAEDWFGSFTALKDRECIMMFTYSAYAAQLEDKGSTDVWGMFPVPLCDNQVVVTNGGGISKYINKNSDAIEESKKFFEFLARDDNLEKSYGERKTLVTSAHKGVESVSETTATVEAKERSASLPPAMFIKDVNYWDSDVYIYMQAFAAGTMTPEKFAEKVDDFRATMFEAVEE